MLRKKFTILSRIKGDVMTIIGKFDFHIQQTTIDVKMNRILNIRIFEFRENFLLNFDIFKKFPLYFFALFVVKTVGYRVSFYGKIRYYAPKYVFTTSPPHLLSIKCYGALGLWSLLEFSSLFEHSGSAVRRHLCIGTIYT